MQAFLITLKIVIGEYEKSTQAIITATDMTLAGQAALVGESHDPENLEWDGMNSVYDLGGEMIYSVKGNVLLSNEDAKVLGKYISGWEMCVDGLKSSGNYVEMMEKECKVLLDTL